MRLVYAAASFTLNMARTCINVQAVSASSGPCNSRLFGRRSAWLSKGKPFGRASSPVCFCVYPARVHTRSRFLPPRSDYRSARVHCTHAWLMAHGAQVIPPRDHRLCLSLSLPPSLTLRVSASLRHTRFHLLDTLRLR